MLAKFHLLIGDPFLIQENAAALRKKITDEAGGEVPYAVIHLTEQPLEAVLSQARTLPFLAAAQIFELRGAETLKTAALETLSRYLERPAPHAYILCTSESMEAKHGLIKLARENGEVHAFEDARKKSAGSRYIRERLKQAGKRISPPALVRLDEQGGEAPVFLETLLTQLLAYAGDADEISEDMVLTLEEKWAELDVFQLVNAVAARRSGQALMHLKQLMIDADRDWFGIVGVLHWQMRRLWQAKVLMEEGLAQGDVLKRCRISPKQAPYFLRQLKGFSRQKLEEALEGLFQIDWQAKTGRAQGAAEMEAWTVKVTS